MGSGKSTVADAVARATHAVSLDHDTTKTAVLAAGVLHPPAGAASYEVLFALAEDLGRQGHSVIIDSPAAYASIPERGLALAEELALPYFFVECDCPEELASQRVSSREARLSQVTDRATAARVRSDPRRAPHRPASGALRLDTSANVASCVQQVLDYLDGGGAEGPVVAST